MCFWQDFLSNFLAGVFAPIAVAILGYIFRYRLLDFFRAILYPRSAKLTFGNGTSVCAFDKSTDAGDYDVSFKLHLLVEKGLSILEGSATLHFYIPIFVQHLRGVPYQVEAGYHHIRIVVDRRVSKGVSTLILDQEISFRVPPESYKEIVELKWFVQAGDQIIPKGVAFDSMGKVEKDSLGKMIVRLVPDDGVQNN